MATIRQVPAVVTEPPFKAMLPFDHRILYFEYEPFLPECVEEIPGSSGSSGGSDGGELYGELAIYNEAGTELITLLDFGDIQDGDIAYENCLLKNIGTGPLTIYSATCSGSFVFDTPGFIAPFVLSPGETRLVRIGINVVT